MKGKYLLSYLDFYVYYVSVFIGLFFLAFVMITHDKGNVVNKSEFLIELQWADSSKNDIDLWVRDPQGTIVSYHKRDTPLMTLDRDDLGTNNAVEIKNGQAVYSNTRLEVVNIRTTTPGDYTVNVVMYRNNEAKPEHPTVTVRKLNPYQEVIKKTVDLDVVGQEKTAVTFTVDEKGRVTNLDETETSLMRTP